MSNLCKVFVQNPRFFLWIYKNIEFYLIKIFSCICRIGEHMDAAYITVQKMKFSINKCYATGFIYTSCKHQKTSGIERRQWHEISWGYPLKMWTNPQFPEDLFTFTSEILNENFIFCAVYVPIFNPDWRICWSDKIPYLTLV